MHFPLKPSTFIYIRAENYIFMQKKERTGSILHDSDMHEKLTMYKIRK